MRSILMSIPVLVMLLPLTALAGSGLPVEGVVTSGVGWRIDPFGSGKLVYHKGIDIAVPTGTPVHAVRKGVVIFAGTHGGHGSAVIVEHDNGERTLYGHNSVITVHRGDMVESGTIVALSGSTGRSTGPHVHFEQWPSGRGVIEAPETIEPVVAQPIQPQLDNSDRQFLFDQMDDAVNSVLRSINRPNPVGQGE